MTEPAPKCPFCEKTGLPILPLRYAVARTDYDKAHPNWKALDLPSGFGAGVTDIALPAAGAKYTARLLRPGYLYAFNEARGEWKAYVVTELGYLYEFDIEDTTPPDAEKIEFSCFRTGEEFVARCITVPDAANATRLWLCFSDTAWTSEVLARHREQAYRERHMRAVDVQQWAGGNTDQPHTAEFARLAEVANEFARKGTERGSEQTPMPPPRYERDPDTGEMKPIFALPEVEIWSYPTFDFSPHQFNGFKHEAEGLVEWASQAAEPIGAPAMLVALDDPVGVTMEIASLMGARVEAFMQRPDLQRPLAISSMLGSLEEAIRNQAELKEITDAQTASVRHLVPGHNLLARDGGRDLKEWHERQLKNSPEYRRQWEEKTKDLKRKAADVLTAEDLDAAAEKAWKKYRKKLRENEPANWNRTTYEPALKIFDRQHIRPLAEAHKAWMGSEAMLMSFDCNHDDQDAESGQGFVDALLLCIQDTQQNQLCFDYYRQWLEATTIEQDNLLQRALVFNQKMVIDALGQEVPAEGLPVDKLPGVKWKSLIGLYDKSLKHLSEDGQNAVARLVTALGGPIMKVLDTALDKTVGAAVITLGLIGRTPVVHIQHVGYVSEALDAMVDAMKKTSPALAEVDASLLKQRLEIKTRRGNRQMTPAGRGKWNIEIRASRLTLEAIPEDLAAQQASKRAANAVMSFKEWETSAPGRWKTLASTKLRLGVIQGIFQVFSMYKLAEALDNSMSHQREENAWRYRAGVAGMVAAVGGVLDEGMKNSAKIYGGRLGRLMGTFWGKLAGVIARAAGFIAAGIMAVWDGIRASREFQEGNITIGILYVVSGVAGIGATVLFTSWGASMLGLTAAAATGIGLIFVVVAIAIALLIEYLKDNKLQDWLERCHFGKFDKDDHYQNIEEELAQFELATGAA